MSIVNINKILTNITQISSAIKVEVYNAYCSLFTLFSEYSKIYLLFKRFRSLLLKVLNVSYGSLEGLSHNLVMKYLSRLSLLLLLLHNQNIINIYNKNLLYFIIIFSIVQLIFSIIINIVNIFVVLYSKNIELQKNNQRNLMFNILKIFGLLFLLIKIYINNFEYLLFSEVILYFFLCLFISYIITYSKNLIFKTKIFKGINILSVFNLSHLRASNLSNINTDENNNTEIDIKESIDIKPDISNNTTNIGVHIHAQDILKQGIETIGKTLESGLALTKGVAVPQIGLASCIGAGISAGVKISAGQPPITRIATLAGLGLAHNHIVPAAQSQCAAWRASIQVGASAVNRSLSQMSSNQKEEILDNSPSPSLSHCAEEGGFINSSNEEILDNPVELLLYSIWVLQFVILIFLVVLLLTFISKLILSISYEFRWLNSIFSEARSIQIRTFILKYFNILSKIREFNIIILIVVLIIISLFCLYFFSVYLLNLEGMCKLYLAKKSV